MEKLRLSSSLEVSRIAQGFWRLLEWGMNTKELVKFINQSFELGVTTFDHADIYGDYGVEEEFGRGIKANPELRSQMQLVTKCGIKLTSSKYPDRRINHYDTSYNHIIACVENSLIRLATDHIDLLLIHRPSPFMNLQEIARAFSQLKADGMVLNFGVSNFNSTQFDSLNMTCEDPLVTNQIEFSPYCHEHIESSNLDFLQAENVHPMAWSPLGGGEVMNPTTERGIRVHKKLQEIAGAYGTTVDAVAYSWILAHPTKPIPIVGSGKIERLKTAVSALDLQLTTEEWFEILIASQGNPVP